MFFKSPFHKNDLFQLCPLGKKTTHRQEYCLAIGTEVYILAQQFLIEVSLSLLFFSLSADTKIAHGRLEIYVLCSLERRLHKGTKQSFLFICLSLTGEMKEWSRCYCYVNKLLKHRKHFFLSRRSWIIRCWIKPPPLPAWNPYCHSNEWFCVRQEHGKKI